MKRIPRLGGRTNAALVVAVVTGVGLASIGCGTNLYAGQYYDAKSTVWMIGKDRVPYRLTIELFAPVRAQGESAYEGIFNIEGVLWMARCPAYKCESTTPYAKTLAIESTTSKPTDATYNSDDAKSIRFVIPGWGSALKVEWKGPGADSPIDTPALAADHDADGSTTWKATAVVSFLGVVCQDASGTVTRHTAVSALGLSQPVGRDVPVDAARYQPSKPRCVAAPKK
jgi:hypothetical protein